MMCYCRCSKCEYKFETTEDLLTHQRLDCGKGDYRDDDNLSISGDEDIVSGDEDTLNEMTGSLKFELRCCVMMTRI